MQNTSAAPRPARLTRSSSNRLVAGVCSGLARYLSADPVIVRLAFVIFAFTGGASILVYLVLRIFMPADDGTEVAALAADRAHETLALVLVAIGGVWLLANFGAFRFIDWQIGWPIVLIGIGLALLARRIRP